MPKLYLPLSSYEKFSIDSEAKIAASKAFVIANSIKNNNKIFFDETKYSSDKIEFIKNISLPKPYNWADKLKAILPEAFYYIWLGIKE